MNNVILRQLTVGCDNSEEIADILEQDANTH